ncbi:MAG: hypothetical protein ISS71_00985 [Phycisphaerae bacterium]|nr:hypothetical protein [Phycisphaerae bacterium]
MKTLYRHKRSGDIFATEIGELGNVRSTNGPLFSDDLDPKLLDYDEYWNTEVQDKLDDFVRITRADYKEILRQNGFVTQFNQKHLFG